MKPLRRSFFLLIILSIMICIVVVSRRAVADVDSQFLSIQGEPLPDQAVRGLAKMEFDIENAKRLIAFDSDRILIEDKKEGLTEYRYAYGVLWCNDFPAVGCLEAFHFEFRNSSGHRVSPARLDQDIRTVEYTLKMRHKDQSVFANQSIDAPRVDGAFQNIFAMLESKT